MSAKKYLAKNLELCEPGNFSTALTVTKLQLNPPNCSFVTVNTVLNNKFIGSQSFKFLAKYYLSIIKYNL